MSDKRTIEQLSEEIRREAENLDPEVVREATQRVWRRLSAFSFLIDFLLSFELFCFLPVSPWLSSLLFSGAVRGAISRSVTYW